MIQFNSLSLHTFLTEFWQKKPLVLRNALPQFSSPVSAEELAGLSLEEDVESRIILQNDKHTYQLLKGPFTINIYETLPESHWTLLIQGMDRLIPEVTELLTHFDFLPRWRIDDIMVSYAVTGGNVGPHFDHYDVFLLQASGQRQWHLTSQACTLDNTIQGLDLRLMETFNVEESFIFNPGDILYLPPKWGHHGIALDDQCMTYSIGYRSYQGQELWDSIGDHLSEIATFNAYYQDPVWPTNLNPGEITDAATHQAQHLLQTILNDHSLLKTCLGRFATQLDQTAFQQLPDPLPPEEALSIEAFLDAIQTHTGLVKDPVCRFAYGQITSSDGNPITQLYLNGHIWDTFQATPQFIAQLANQPKLTQSELEHATQHSGNLTLLFNLWQQQYLVFMD